jgi:3-oxoacyl-[acyl-carrier protein] reductase
MVRMAGATARGRGGDLMDLGLDGKVALVTGASKGIGRGIAEALVAEGANVAITSREQERADETASAIGARGYAFDSNDLDAIGPLLEAVTRDLGPIDVYVANTGGPPAGDPLEFTREQWEAAQRTLLISPTEIIRRVVPGMRERGFGRIVAIGGTAVREPIDALQLSNAHRPGLVATFKVLARKFAADGVTFNHVHPGQIATDRMIDTAGSIEEAQKRAKANIPAGRLGTVEELAAAAAFLCSQPASYITGTSVFVDGGLSRST